MVEEATFFLPEIQGKLTALLAVVAAV